MSIFAYPLGLVPDFVDWVLGIVSWVLVLLRGVWIRLLGVWIGDSGSKRYFFSNICLLFGVAAV